jgi:hypothetical protein
MTEQTQQREQFDRHVEQAGNRLATAIHDLWLGRDETLWSADPWFHLRLAGLADDLGQTMFAHDVLKDGLRCFPEHPRLTQLASLSLVKSGFLLSARNLLTAMIKRGQLDEETLGILGRVYKEMWLIEGNGAADHPHLAKARELYLGAFNRSRGPYSGINAASLSLIMGDRKRADLLARTVIRLCAERWKRERLFQPGEHPSTASPARELPGCRREGARHPAHPAGRGLLGAPDRRSGAAASTVPRVPRGGREAADR